ncbi:hypothetical protein BT93_F3379 [Corymbia citriodora subsp. variegata]|nr:hypothetical protein BT93_F3379 [Corymbia citriodora subsp. variegata]
MMSSTTPPSMPTMIANVFGPLSFADRVIICFLKKLLLRFLFRSNAKQDRCPGSRVLLSQQLIPCVRV